MDEAGRGSWAGPVVSAAVILKNYPNAKELKDSKILNKKDKKEIFDKLKNNSIIGVGFSSVEEIEKFNILQATFLSMIRAINSLAIISALHRIKNLNSYSKHYISQNTKNICMTNEVRVN